MTIAPVTIARNDAGPKDPVGPIVQLVDVSKEYHVNEITISALKSINLSIPRGQFVVLLGPSGSGKTTLLNIIGGIDSCTSGEVWVADREISKLDEGELTLHRRTQVGFIFQFFNLVPTLTARENVEMVAELVDNHDRVEDAITQVGLQERASHFPSQLSGGEQQRVAIARALAKASPILLCDEPTGELDFETGKLVLGAIKRTSSEEGKTVIVVTHNAAVGEMADRVIRLRSGELVEDRINETPISSEELVW